MAILGIIATILFPCLCASAKTPVDTVFTSTIYFRKSSAAIQHGFRNNGIRIDSIRQFMAGTATADSMKIDIHGMASPEGTEAFNMSLARMRAESLRNSILPLTGIEPDMDWSVAADALPEQWPGLRRASVCVWRYSREQGGHSGLLTDVITSADASSAEQCEPSSGQCCNDTVHAATVAETAVSSIADSRQTQAGGNPAPRRGGLKLFIGTNLLYDAALTPNLSAAIYLGRKFTIYADWMHAWWSNHPDRRYWRVYGGDIELRYQFGHSRSISPFAGHHIGAYASIVTYDFQFGRDKTGVIGDKYNYAVGLSYGYALPVARRLNIDFAIGIGYMWGRYIKQHLVDDHDVWVSTHDRKWFGPTRIEIGLHWLIGPDNTNRRKGGDI